MIGELAALGAALTWAVAPILYRKALFMASPFSANMVRSTSNAAVLVLILVLSGLAGILTRLPLLVVALVALSGVIGLGLGDTLYMAGLKSIGLARAVPLASTYPLFSLLWSTLLGAPLTAAAISGTVVILLGIWVLGREKTESAVHVHGKLELTGVALSLLTAVMWSVSITMMDVAVTMPGVVNSFEVNYAIVTLRIAGMALVILALSPLFDRKRVFLKLGRRAALLLCVGGLVGNGLGWLLMNYSFLNIAEAEAVPISSTTPLFSTLAGFAFFHERLTRENVLGAALVVAGVILIFIV